MIVIPWSVVLAVFETAIKLTLCTLLGGFVVALLLHPPKSDDKNGQETDQRFIRKRNTTYKIHTLAVFETAIKLLVHKLSQENSGRKLFPDDFASTAPKLQNSCWVFLFEIIFHEQSVWHICSTSERDSEKAQTQHCVTSLSNFSHFL